MEQPAGESRLPHLQKTCKNFIIVNDLRPGRDAHDIMLSIPFNPC